MTRKQRGVLIGLAVVVALIGAEFTLQRLKGTEACVQIDNLGAEPIEGLVVASGSSRAAAAQVQAGESVRLFLGGKGPQTLRLTFRQRGNGLTGFEMRGFDSALLAGEGSRLVLQIRPNEVVRFQDEAEPTTLARSFARNLWRRFVASISTPP